MNDGYTTKRFSGHLVLSGIILLFVRMAFDLGAIALTGHPGGSTLMSFTNILGFLWWPLVGIGALLRATGADNPVREHHDPRTKKDATEDSPANGA